MPRCCVEKHLDDSPRLKPDINRILYDERVIGYLDPGAEKVLLKLNSKPLLWTTSSCTGRISIVEGLHHWERSRARIVYKTHTTVTLGEVLRVLSRPFKDLWLKATGPIIHFQTPSHNCAFNLLEAARRAGFKHSGVISSSEVYTVEVIAPTRIDAPLRLDWNDLYTMEGLKILVEAANRVLTEGRNRLERLSVVVESLDSC